jgi:carbamoyl-phosphate synthase small subunit
VLLSLQGKFPIALLALADGTVFHGQSMGASGSSVGEVVFNTSMTGYQEILTDPSYAQQLVTFTYPHIGNYGINQEDVESQAIQAAGMIIKELPLAPSNFRSHQSLQSYLIDSGKLGIMGLDTRRLTRILRTHGAQNGAILALKPGESLTPAHEAEVCRLAKAAPSMAGLDLAQTVTTHTSFEWSEGEWALGSGFTQSGAASTNPNSAPLHVVAYDFGVKRNILRMLHSRGAKITVVPAKTTVADVLALSPQGVFLSNGPGDPEPCDYAIAAAREFMKLRMPLFGICLGHQIMALASGAKTFKMKFGHHGANHPVKDLVSGRVSITSQNHGFAVNPESLPENLRATHVSLFDGSLQGLERTDCPAFSFQGHPEASPGPQDIATLFDRFIQMMETHNHA